MKEKHGKHGRRFVCVGGDEDVRTRSTTKQKPIIFDQICLQLLITARNVFSFFLSLPFSHTRARAGTHASPRSRARTRKPALQCAAQEPLTVPVPDCDRCRSTGCLRRGHLPPPVTAPIPAAESDPFAPLNFRNVRRCLIPAPI